ncbi:MAG: WG repeat-containing protein, partial [Pleurocapsa sp.]
NTFIAIEGDELNGSLLDRGYVVFARQGREGIADLTGKIIIPAKFHISSNSDLRTTDIKLIQNAYLIAKQNGKSGLLNIKTKKFLALDYDTISNSLSRRTLDPNRLIAYKNKQADIIDLQGNTIASLKDKPIYIYQNGVIVYLNDNENNFDRDPQADLIEPDTTANTIDKNRDLFIDNLAVLTTEGKYQNYYCVINRQGELLVKSQHHNWGAREKIDNLCRSLVGIEVDNTAIKENPRPSESGNFDFYFRGGLRIVEVNGKWGFVDEKGDFVIYPQFDWITSFSEDLAAVKIDDKYGYINKSGEIAVAPQFDKTGSFLGGFAKVIQDGKKNFIDTTGKTILNTKNYPQLSEKEALYLR